MVGRKHSALRALTDGDPGRPRLPCARTPPQPWLLWCCRAAGLRDDAVPRKPLSGEGQRMEPARPAQLRKLEPTKERHRPWVAVCLVSSVQCVVQCAIRRVVSACIRYDAISETRVERETHRGPLHPKMLPRVRMLHEHITSKSHHTVPRAGRAGVPPPWTMPQAHARRHTTPLSRGREFTERFFP